MNEFRVTVKLLFGNIKNYFKFIDFKKEMKLCLSPVGKAYAVCALLLNAHTCLLSIHLFWRGADMQTYTNLPTHCIQWS